MNSLVTNIISLITVTLSISIFYSYIDSESYAQTNQTLDPSLQEICFPTQSNPLGPYYKDGAPFRESLAEGSEGKRLIITGKVLNVVGCEPLEGAILDIWQTDSNGTYDNEGYNFRGKIMTDKDGNYVIDTIHPGQYTQNDIWRPSHIHLKVGVPDQPVITTQLYFEGDPHLEDFIHPSLILNVTEEDGVERANFDFAVEYHNEYVK